MQRIVLGLVLLALARAAQPQAGEINFLTDLLSPFPPGCVSLDLPAEPASPENVLVDRNVPAPTINSQTLDGQVRVTIWRVGCADEGFSVVMVRLRQTGGANPIVLPQVFAEAGQVELPFHEAQLIRRPAAGNVGVTGGIVTQGGETYMLAVDPVAIDGQSTFLPPDYNDTFTLEMFWGAFAPAGEFGELFFLDAFAPEADLPQFDQPVLNGRFSGQWAAEGVERTGLLLQVAETLEDENFVFAIFFTYLDGQPVWVVGNTGAKTAEPGVETFPVFILEGGEFFTSPNQPPRDQISQQQIGTIEIVPLDCNRLRLNYNFSEFGQGTGSLDFERFIRIAGYDCNPWSASPGEP